MKSEPNNSHYLYSIKLLYWWYIFLALIMFLIVFLATCMGSDNWVKQGMDEFKWRGNLTRVIAGPIDIDGFTYSELKNSLCTLETDLKRAQCETFQDLAESGGIFIIYGVLSITFTMLWMFRVGLSVIHAKLISSWMSYILPALGYSCHILGLIFFSLVSGSTYTNDCTDLNHGKDRTDVCTSNGPAIAVSLLIVYRIIAGAYMFIYYKSRRLVYQKM